MSAPHWSASLAALGACPPAQFWAARQPDAATAWAMCHDGSWLVWLCARLADAQSQRALVVHAAAQCARSVLHLVHADRREPLEAVLAAESWAAGATVSALALWDKSLCVSRAAEVAPGHIERAAMRSAHAVAMAAYLAQNGDSQDTFANVASAGALSAIQAHQWMAVGGPFAGLAPGRPCRPLADLVREHLTMPDLP